MIREQNFERIEMNFQYLVSKKGIAFTIFFSYEKFPSPFDVKHETYVLSPYIEDAIST